MKIVNFILVLIISLISVIFASNSSKHASKYNPGGGVQREYTKKAKKFKKTKHSKYAKNIMDRNLIKKRKNKRKN